MRRYTYARRTVPDERLEAFLNEVGAHGYDARSLRFDAVTGSWDVILRRTEPDRAGAAAVYDFRPAPRYTVPEA